jgi:hypothetical protein
MPKHVAVFYGEDNIILGGGKYEIFVEIQQYKGMIFTEIVIE